MIVRVVAVVIIVALGGFVFYKHQATKDTSVTQLEGPKDTPFEKPGVEAEGVEPPAPPDFDIAIDLVDKGPQKLIQFTVTERHGWYADTIEIHYWYVEQGEDGEWRQVGDTARFLCRSYLDFGGTLVDSTVLYELEFPQLEDFGTPENWRARVHGHGKVLAPK